MICVWNVFFSIVEYLWLNNILILHSLGIERNNYFLFFIIYKPRSKIRIIDFLKYAIVQVSINFDIWPIVIKMQLIFPSKDMNHNNKPNENTT